MFLKIQRKILADSSVSLAFIACKSYRCPTSGTPKHNTKFLATIRTRHLLNAFKKRVFWGKIEKKIVGFEADEREYLRDMIKAKLADLIGGLAVV